MRRSTKLSREDEAANSGGAIASICVLIVTGLITLMFEFLHMVLLMVFGDGGLFLFATVVVL